MSKIAVVYWSGTGNTETMANAVVEGIKEGGNEAELFMASEFTPEMIDNYSAVAFGCPAMGSEVLEEGEFEPMFASCEQKIVGKNIALFGSYGWGGGEWMKIWEERCAALGVSLAAESVVCCDAPDGEAIELCKALGSTLAAK